MATKAIRSTGALLVVRLISVGSDQPLQLKCCSYGGNHAANYRGCSRWKEAKAALTKQTLIERSRMHGATGRPAALKEVRAEPSVEQKSLGPGGNHVVRKDRVFKASHISTTYSQTDHGNP
jgi:hypothetical protein